MRFLIFCPLIIDTCCCSQSPYLKRTFEYTDLFAGDEGSSSGSRKKPRSEIDTGSENSSNEVGDPSSNLSGTKFLDASMDSDSDDDASYCTESSEDSLEDQCSSDDASDEDYLVSQPIAGPSTTQPQPPVPQPPIGQARPLARANERIRPTVSGGCEIYTYNEGPEYEARLEREAQILRQWRMYEEPSSGYPFRDEFDFIRRAATRNRPPVVFDEEEE